MKALFEELKFMDRKKRFQEALRHFYDALYIRNIRIDIACIRLLFYSFYFSNKSKKRKIHKNYIHNQYPSIMAKSIEYDQLDLYIFSIF